MHFKPLWAALTAALALAVAGPAAALNLTFLVKVDTIDGAPVGAPTEFYETWTFEPADLPIFSPPDLERKRWGSNGPSVSASPYTDGILAATGLVGATPSFPQAHFNTTKFLTGDLVGQATLQFGMTYFDSGGSYNRTLSRVTPDSSKLYDSSLAGLTAFFADVGYANFQERGFAADGYSKVITGKAYLQVPTAPAPEPGTWALMIGGFAMAGGALRRRRIARA